MSATARDYQSPEPANTDGLDDLFEVLPTGADSVATGADSVATGADNLATDADSGEWITVAEAASSLKKSERSIQRYAKSGKLRSKTDESGRLLIWSATSADIFIACADNVATDADSAKSVATDADTERLWNLLKEKDAKIEALLMRNGYLQAQVETSQEAIKLLTDSEHKTGWWAKFSSWFFKAQ
jgi:hypothetical protein